ncbi:MAG: RNA methyltransferase [Clostridium argentinense]|uniref:RNA methyltransferase n=1 Tax=Clostridium faecium TaxID=2762223 RepID=A0ABR8YVJ6_9CLOT|nr:MULTISPECIES: RNA methyltransferase [Clostridium]MBD8048023.1 RNA methyltransferase [Clostridium faecium]MBS5824893.1 RNA methyltransferase [Clostridium argentinense]MDU1347859.1 RNA methyltransferase [Clostridium argentinense]
MQYISSKENSLIKQIKKLKEKKHRVESNTFLVEGFRFVEEALKSSFNVKYIFINENADEEYCKKYINRYKCSAEIYSVSNMVFKTLSSTETPQGAIAVVENKSLNFKYSNGFYILVDKVQDPGNLGTIIRTAHAAGGLGVILTKGTVDVYNEKTLRSTMGSIFNIPVIEDKDLSVIKELKNKGYKLITSSLDTNNNFYDIDLSGKSIITVGNEGKGISREVYEISDEKVKIPMPGGAESLNASVAASIMMYEAVRQKNILK